MAAYKRSNPAKLLKDKEQIVRDMENQQNVPQPERMFPNLPERIRRGVQGFIEYKDAENHPKPRREGAVVTGLRKKVPPA